MQEAAPGRCCVYNEFLVKKEKKRRKKVEEQKKRLSTGRLPREAEDQPSYVRQINLRMIIRLGINSGSVAYLLSTCRLCCWSRSLVATVSYRGGFTV